jgi:hypothetical protein
VVYEPLFTEEESFTIFRVARATALQHPTYRVAVQQIKGLSQEECKWLLKHWQSKGWIQPMSGAGLHDFFHAWVLAFKYRAYEPGVKREMEDEEHEYFIGIACMVAKPTGQIQVTDFERHAPREGLWRLLETGDMIRVMRRDNNGNFYFLDPIHRDEQ